MKKLLAVIMLCAVILASGSLFAEGEVKKVFVSIYNDIQKEYAVENTLIESKNGESVLQTIKILKLNSFIKNYELSEEGTLKSVRFLDNTKLSVLEKPTATEFAVKLNGEIITEAQKNEPLSDGDIIEFIYCIAGEYKPVFEEEEDSEGKPVSGGSKPVAVNKLWTNELSQYGKEACEWLNKNQADSSSYLLAFGAAGRAADVKKVSEILSEIKSREEYASPIDLAKDIINLSFCGYDLSGGEFSPLISKLLSYDDINNFGVFGAINALTAYDIKDYKIAGDVINSRQKLINIILSYQNEDGSFSIFAGTESDIDTTAMAITALSGYMDQPAVKEAIEKAKEHIIKSQTEAGGFGRDGAENCESLAQVIIAMNSIGVSLDDEAFVRGGKNLIDQLLEYHTDEGGFSHLKDFKPSAMPTEQAIIALSSIKRGGNPYKATESIAPIDGEKNEYRPEEIKTFNYTIWFIIIDAILTVIVLLIVLVAVLKKKEKNTKSEKDK